MLNISDYEFSLETRKMKTLRFLFCSSPLALMRKNTVYKAGKKGLRVKI